MGDYINEKLEKMAHINDDGYIFDASGHHIAQITDSGYITKVASYETLGKIDEDGSIRDASLNVIGRIESNGYIYIHSNRVGNVSSTFIEKITPKAWNAGEPSSYEGRKTESYAKSYDDSYSYSSHHSLPIGLIIKLIIGLILGIAVWISSESGIEGALFLVLGPALVFVVCLIVKIFRPF